MPDTEILLRMKSLKEVQKEDQILFLSYIDYYPWKDRMQQLQERKIILEILREKHNIEMQNMFNTLGRHQKNREMMAQV